MSAVSGLLAVVVLLASPPAPGQGAAAPATRAESLRQQREAKLSRSHPYEPNPLESAMHLVEDRLMPLLMRDGIYARLGSLTTGSGFAYGAGLRNRALVDGRGTLDVWAAGSLEKFWTVEGRVGYPVTAGGEVTVEGYGRRYSYPSVDFSGLGPDSAGGDLSEFKSHGSLAGGAVRVAPGRVVRAGGGIEYLWPRTGPGPGGKTPSVEALFSDAELPGFGTRANFRRTSAFVEVDYREPLNARKGGWYRIDVSHYRDRTTDRRPAKMRWSKWPGCCWGWTGTCRSMKVTPLGSVYLPTGC
jgi:hypothetical protein